MKKAMRNELGRSTTRKTEDLTNTLIKHLGKFKSVERERYMRPNFKDVFAIDEDGNTWGFEIKTHVGDITQGKNWCVLDDCNYNYMVVSPDCYYYAVKWIEENHEGHAGVIVGNRLWLDVMKEAVRIE